jgi:DNA ligase-associated metallophosphoesterase
MCRTGPGCAAASLAALTALKRRGSLAKPSAPVQGKRMVPLSFAGEEFALTSGRALYWPRERALLVADLHLEKASFFARHGQMLPPYDSRETLERLALAIRETGARRVFTLGDNFHDSAGVERLEPHAAGMLAALTRATDWVWITGNHDAAMEARAGGALAEEIEIAGMVLRHRARVGETRPELSGHYHPRVQVTVRERHIRRPCAVVSRDATGGGRMILPAFGALTGGMNAADPAILAALQPARSIDAVVPAGGRLVRFPLWRAA